MPALKYIAERSVQRPVDLYSNATIAKEFTGANGKTTLHWGKVVSHRYDKDSELLFRISYEDGDSEEFNVAEMMIHTRLAAATKRTDNFTVPHAPRSRHRRKLSEILRHAKTVNPTSNKATENSSKQSQIKVNPPSSKPPMPTRQSKRKIKPPSRMSPRILGNVSHVRAFMAEMFDLETENGRKRKYLKQAWAYTIACGAMIEPPPSDIPEIIVTADTKASSIPIPKSYREAVTGPYRRYWIEAIRRELENLLSRKVWREEKLPLGSRPVSGRYVWKVKPTDAGTIAKWKARYIIHGFRQRAGIDFENTHANVANVVTVRVMLAIACELGWELHASNGC